jgi:hypothetical protein
MNFSPLPLCHMPQSPVTSQPAPFHLFGVDWLPGATGTAGLEISGLIGLMFCPGTEGNLGVRLPSGLMPGTGASPGLTGKEGTGGWLSGFVGD